MSLHRGSPREADGRFVTALGIALLSTRTAAIPLIGALGAAVVSARQWRTGAGTRGARLRYSSAVVITLLFVWSLSQWNLLGWRM